jgi:hypothetical protein
MLEKRQMHQNNYVFALGNLENMIHKTLTVNHIRSVGLTTSTIHEVDFTKKVFKGVLFFEEVIQRLLDDVFRSKLHWIKNKIRRSFRNSSNYSLRKTKRSFKLRNEKG